MQSYCNSAFFSFYELCKCHSAQPVLLVASAPDLFLLLFGGTKENGLPKHARDDQAEKSCLKPD